MFAMFDRELIEAEISLELIPSEKMPEIAWQALEAGIDGRWIRRLAALESPTFFEVSYLFGKAKNEMGLKEVAKEKAAYILASRWARELLTSGDNPLAHMKKFEWLWIRSGYPSEIQAVGTLDDEIFVAESMGQSEAEIKRFVTARLREFCG